MSNNQIAEYPSAQVQDELSLGQIRDIIPADLMEPPSVKNVIYFIVKFAICVFAFVQALYAVNIWMKVLYVIIAGIFAFSLGTVGHDAGHNSYARPRWLNDFIGKICLYLVGQSFYSWQHFHNTHHKYTNTVEIDPDRTWLYEDEYNESPTLKQKLWTFFITKGFPFIAIIHYFRVMLPWGFCIADKTDNVQTIKKVRQDLIFFGIFMIWFQYTLFSIGGLEANLLYILVAAIQYIGLGTYVRTQHYNLPCGKEVIDKPWLSSRTMAQPKFLDFLVSNLNYHIEHHISPTLPGANLPAVQQIIKPYLQSKGIHYNEEPIAPFLVSALTAPPVLLPRS